MFNGNTSGGGLRSKTSVPRRSRIAGLTNAGARSAATKPVRDLGHSFVSKATVPSWKIRESAEELPNRELSQDTLQVGSVPLLSVEEEVELAVKIKKGDQEARERMIRANLRLVLKIARDYENLGLPTADLVSEGIVGLMKAVERFDPAKGGKLSTYAALWIKQQIRRALANQGRTIRLPVHVEGKLHRLRRAEVEFRAEFGREATDEEMASELSVPTHRISRLRESSLRPVSLDATIGEDKDATISDIIPDESATSPDVQLQKRADLQLLGVVLGRLPKRHAEILRCRFGLNGGEEKTLEEVGIQFGLTRERIRQLQNEAFRKLRLMMEEPSSVSAGLE